MAPRKAWTTTGLSAGPEIVKGAPVCVIWAYTRSFWLMRERDAYDLASDFVRSRHGTTSAPLAGVSPIECSQQRRFGDAVVRIGASLVAFCMFSACASKVGVGS